MNTKISQTAFFNNFITDRPNLTKLWYKTSETSLYRYELLKINNYVMSAVYVAKNRIPWTQKCHPHAKFLADIWGLKSPIIIGIVHPMGNYDPNSHSCHFWFIQTGFKFLYFLIDKVLNYSERS